MDVAGHDADLAALICVWGVVGAFAGFGAWCDDAGAVGPDECDRLFVFGVALEVDEVEGVLGADHVLDWHAFGDDDDEGDVCVGGFEDGVCGEGWWDEDHGGVGAGVSDGVVDCVEDRQAVGVCVAAFAWRDAADHCSGVEVASLGVEGTE